jgi:dCMP deaminase
MKLELHSRPSWDEYFLAGTLWAATRGDCRRSQVGALLVDIYDHRVIAQGYNGTEPGKPGCLLGGCPRGLLSYEEQPAGGDYSNCIANHAEWNCMDYAIRYHPYYNYSRTSMYVSRKPCSDCEDYLRTEGVSRAVWPGGYLDLRPGRV